MVRQRMISFKRNMIYLQKKLENITKSDDFPEISAADIRDSGT